MADCVTFRQLPAGNFSSEEKFGCIVCNPPYVDAQDMASLPPGLRRKVDLPRGHGQPARRAEVEVRWGQVQIQPPAVGALLRSVRAGAFVMFVVARVVGRADLVGGLIGATFSAVFVSALGGAFVSAGVGGAGALHGPVMNRASMVIDAAVDGQGVTLARTTLAAWISPARTFRGISSPKCCVIPASAR